MWQYHEVTKQFVAADILSSFPKLTSKVRRNKFQSTLSQVSCDGI